MQTNNQRHWRGQNRFGVLQSPILKKLSLFDLPGKHSQGLFLFDQTQSSLYVQSPIHYIFVENNQQQLFNITVSKGILPVAANKTLNKKFKRKNRGMKCP